MTGKAFEWEKEITNSRLRGTAKVLRKMGQLLAKHKFKVMLIIVVIVSKMALALTTPLTIAKLIDTLVEGLIRPLFDSTREFYMDWSKLNEVGFTLGLKFAAGYGLVTIHKYLVGIVVAALILTLKSEMKGKMDSFSFWKDNALRKTELNDKIQDDLDKMGEGIEKGFTTLVAALVTITGTVLIMFYLHFHIAVIAILSTVIALVALLMVRMKKTQKGFLATLLCWKTFKYFLLFEIGFVALAFLSGGLSLGQIQIFLSYEKKMADQLEKRKCLKQSWEAITSARHAYEMLEETQH
ncbi:MAG: ABC transporter transmembrane domain-containing protein [Turicibacter sp.]|nr:ABC transporter transmembrane domain-containing protein [Turicibacter sp.]